ncbi:MAG: dihydrofolate reductase [Candidatus Marinimicrobia bacterium]|nr:dihydrofolate reductase [Candidatus Neomarinimicrobiota bacterium]
MKITVFMALSLDGFIADLDGSVDWLNALSETEVGNAEDYGFAKLMEAVDALVMGSKTFEQVLKFGIWGYGKLPVIVLSNRPPASNIPDEAQVTYASGSPSELIIDWESQGITHIYLDGGQVVNDFLKADLIDEMILTQVPAILGNGLPLFHQALDPESWSMESTTSYPNGFVQRLLKNGASSKNLGS